MNKSGEVGIDHCPASQIGPILRARQIAFVIDLRNDYALIPSIDLDDISGKDFLTILILYEMSPVDNLLGPLRTADIFRMCSPSRQA